MNEGWGIAEESVTLSVEDWGKEQGKKTPTQTKKEDRDICVGTLNRQNEIPFGILWLGKQPGFILEASCACGDEKQRWLGNHPSLVWTEGRECFLKAIRIPV